MTTTVISKQVGKRQEPVEIRTPGEAEGRGWTEEDEKAWRP